ncbi:unnamed protein product, partial [Ixodes pacificus]
GRHVSPDGKRAPTSPGVLARDGRRTIPVHRHGRRAGRLARHRHARTPGSDRGDSAEEQRPEQTEAWMQRPLITVRQESRAAEGKEARRLSERASAAAAERGPEPCRRLQARAGGH